MLLFTLFIAAVLGLFYTLARKAVSEYSLGDFDAQRSLDYWYYQSKSAEKQLR